MQNIVLDNIKFPTGKEKDGARFRQIQEERLNRNFRRLLENDANKNSATALPDSIRVGDNIDIYKPTVHHEAVLEQFGSTVATHSASGNYAKVCNFAHRGIPSPQSYTGNLVNFMASAVDTITALSADITAVQSGSGTPSPSNPRAISGLTGLTVYVNSTNSSSGATTYNIDWTSDAGTVYGGTMDVVTGVLTVTHGVKVLDGSENWSWSANNNLATTAVQNGIVTNSVTQYNSYTQNSTFNDKSWVWRSSVDGSIGMFYGASAIYAKYSGFTTAAEAKAFFAENPTTVVYELATPLTYQLTPQTVSALIGQNYIWSSANENLSLTVQQNTNLAVDNALTLEWLRSSDSTPTKTTIRFNSAFGLDSFITDNGLCYMSYANGIWSFFVEKTSVDDIINIIDFHNPWSNTDMMIDWEDTSVSTLPTGAMQAISVPIVVETGTSNGWEYRLYSDKKIIATRTIEQSIASYTTWNGMYGYNLANISTPFTMTNTIYYVSASWKIGSGFSIPAGVTATTTTSFNLLALSSASGAQDCIIRLYLEGYKQ